MHLQILLSIVTMAALVVASAQKERSCETSCGNVTIMFPFGFSEECYHSSDFLVTCDRSSGEPIPFLGPITTGLVISNISISMGELETRAFVARDCYNSRGQISGNRPSLTLDKIWSNIRVSSKNRFVAIGCDTHAFFRGKKGNEFIGTGCISTCGSSSYITNGSCTGVGCCEVAVPEGMTSFRISLSSYNNHTNITDFSPCSYGFFVEEGKFQFSTNDLSDFRQKQQMPMLLEWVIGNSTCEEAKEHLDSFRCLENSDCDLDYKGPGYRCRCRAGYEGNPYYLGCKDIDECSILNDPVCHLYSQCFNEPAGNYTCKCTEGYSGDGRKDGNNCTLVIEASPPVKQPSENNSVVIKIAVGSSAAAIFLIVFANWLYFGLRKHKLMMLKEKFFRQNGGIMLQQRISGDGGYHDQAKVFTIEELKVATNNYHETRIIGKGGYGIVYKGVLSDNRTVAIKKSKLADQTQSQIEQFINEVVILSQINHRNVVKLIGCCLEEQVPLLVYEFIPNGTLSDHIHNKGKSSAITWDIRLRIAAETAEALSYLHSAASVPIIHRDIKPMNILLDDNFVAKVADFGASRLIPMDQIELETIVQGTLGYLDPEYLQTNQLTHKSDVYSFGVVLVELLTGKKALSFDRPEEERNLAMHFLSSLKGGRLIPVLDKQLQQNEVLSEVINVSRLAERCLHVKGDERPTMKEVAMELEGILASMIQKHPWVQHTLNENEDEYFLNIPTEDYECTNGANESSITFETVFKPTILPISSSR